MTKPVLDLRNVSGNAFAILGAAQRRMRELNVPEDERKAFLSLAMEGDYNNMLRLVMERFEILTSPDDEGEE